MTDNDQAQVEAAVMELVEERDSSIEQYGYASVPPPRQHAQQIIERVDELRERVQNGRTLRPEVEGRVHAALLEMNGTTLPALAEFIGQPVEEVERPLRLLVEMKLVELIQRPEKAIGERYFYRVIEHGWPRREHERSA